MNERGDHSGTLYTTHMYMCKCIQYMSLYMRKPGVTSPTTKTLICTDIAAKALQFTHGLMQYFVIIETIISQ